MVLRVQSTRLQDDQCACQFVETVLQLLLLKHVIPRMLDAQAIALTKLDFTVLFKTTFQLVSLDVEMRLKQEQSNVIKEQSMDRQVNHVRTVV